MGDLNKQTPPTNETEMHPSLLELSIHDIPEERITLTHSFQDHPKKSPRPLFLPIRPKPKCASVGPPVASPPFPFLLRSLLVILPELPGVSPYLTFATNLSAANNYTRTRRSNGLAGTPRTLVCALTSLHFVEELNTSNQVMSRPRISRLSLIHSFAGPSIHVRVDPTAGVLKRSWSNIGDSRKIIVTHDVDSPLFSKQQQNAQQGATRSDLSQSNSSNKKATALRGIEMAAWVHPEHDGFVKYSERAGPSLLGLRTSLIVDQQEWGDLTSTAGGSKDYRMADQIAYLHEQMGCQDQQIWDMSMGFMLLLMVIPLLTQGFALDTQAPNAFPSTPASSMLLSPIYLLVPIARSKGS
eukprot:Gb_00619 [translate_table: standard]